MEVRHAVEQYVQPRLEYLALKWLRATLGTSALVPELVSSNIVCLALAQSGQKTGFTLTTQVMPPARYLTKVRFAPTRSGRFSGRQPCIPGSVPESGRENRAAHSLRRT